MTLFRRLKVWFRRRRFHADLRHELEFHRAEIQRDLECRGLLAGDAALESRRRMGNVTLALEDARHVWTPRWVDALLQDSRYAVRTFKRQIVFSVVALLTLALGIGATTAIFSIVYAIALKPLPYGNSHELLQVSSGRGASPLTLEQYDALEVQAHTLRNVAAARREHSALATAGGDEPVVDYACTPNLFQLLEVPAEIGRTFTTNEAGRAVIVLAHEWWIRQFGGDRAILGRSVVLDKAAYEVIGVMPADFRFPYRRSADAWIPADAGARAHTEHLGVWETVARLRPGESLSAARAELSLISARLKSRNSAYEQRALGVTPLLEAVVGVPIRTRLVVLLLAVGFILLMACVNVAGLMLTRVHVRAKEFALRAAIGANGSRLVRQLLTESMLLSVAGGAAGLLLAHWILAITLNIIPSGIPRVESIRINAAVLCVGLLVTLSAGTMVGMLPAWRVSRSGLHQYLTNGVALTTPAGATRTAGFVLFAETSLAFVLLIGAALVIHSFEILTHVDPGFDASHLMTVAIANHLPPAQIEDMASRLSGLPGAEAVTGADLIPFLGPTITSDLEVQGRPAHPFDLSNAINLERVLPGYFRVLRIRLVRGRALTERDVAGAPMVAMINQAAVKKYFPAEDPIGLTIYGQDGWYRIVGIVDDTRWTSLADAAPPAAYFPMLQGSDWRFNMTAFLIRMKSGIRTSPKDLESQAAAVMGHGMRIQLVESVNAMMARSIQQWTFQTIVLGMFGALALLLAVVGIFGVTSHAVAQRTREIGLRLALGGQRSDMLRLIVGSTARPVVAGLVAGLCGAMVATRGLAAFLFQITPTDGPTYAATVSGFFAVAMLAAAIPAHRATRVDPVTTLRQE